MISGSAVYRRLLTYVWPHRYAFLIAMLGNVLYGAVDGGLTKLLQPLLDEGFVKHNLSFIQWIPFIVIGIFILRGAATFLSTYFMGLVGRKVVMTFRRDMFAHLLRLPSSFYDNNTSGETLSKLTYNVEQVANVSSDALTTLVRESCTALFLIAVMFSASWRLTLLFIVTVPLMAAIMQFVSRKMRHISGGIQDSIGQVTHVAEEAIEGQKVIKAFGGEAYERAQFDVVTKENQRKEMKLIVTSSISAPLVQAVGSLALAAIIYLATLNPNHMLGSAITPGEFTALMTSMIILLKPIKQLTKLDGTIQKGIAAASSIFEFLDLPQERDTGTQTLDNPRGAVAFRNVSFGYREGSASADILARISFEAKAGETIAIVGRSGGGKSTLVSLLPRFYDAQGEIFIDGMNINDLPLASLRSHIAIVSQNVTLFNDTIANNIAYGAMQEQASLEEIIAAAESAYARGFIEALPEGFDTVIGENGVRLSGGQRQRIAIARAILKKAPILILDEATSALDTESERHIQAALDKLMTQCTTLVIAHRLSTIENADRIMVIEQGRIVEMGSHLELMRLQGVYAALREMQYQAPTAKISPVSA